MLNENPFIGLNLARTDDNPGAEKCTHGSIWVYVDEVYQRVLENGWEVESAIQDQFWGERQFTLRDLNGNRLVITQRIEEIDLDQIQAHHKKIRKGGRDRER
jgi:hypothetical protein